MARNTPNQPTVHFDTKDDSPIGAITLVSHLDLTEKEIDTYLHGTARDRLSARLNCAILNIPFNVRIDLPVTGLDDPTINVTVSALAPTTCQRWTMDALIHVLTSIREMEGRIMDIVLDHLES